MVNHCYNQTDVTMVDQACQTDMPHTSNSPQKIKSISLADLRHTVSNDHNYASSEDSFPLEDVICQPKQSVRKLGFSEIAVSYKEEQSEDEWLMEMSDSDESELSDVDSDFGEENSDPEDNCDDTKLFKKSEVHDDEEEKESNNWLDDNCGDFHEERKFLVFESKLKELFSQCVKCPNCGRNVKKPNT